MSSVVGVIESVPVKLDKDRPRPHVPFVSSLGCFSTRDYALRDQWSDVPHFAGDARDEQ